MTRAQRRRNPEYRDAEVQSLKNGIDALNEIVYVKDAQIKKLRQELLVKGTNWYVVSFAFLLGYLLGVIL
jgi:hypothetical protein